MLCAVFGVLTLKLLQAGQWILTIKKAELLINQRIGMVQQVWCAEKVFAGDREKLGRVFGCIWINGRLAIGVVIEEMVEMVVGLLHGLCPVGHMHAVVQRRHAVVHR